MRPDLPDHFKSHTVLPVIHTRPFFQQPSYIAASIPVRPEPIPSVNGKEHVAEFVLQHRKRGRGYQFLSLMRADPIYDAVWHPTSDFVDDDGTVTKVWHYDIVKKLILPQYH